MTLDPTDIESWIKSGNDAYDKNQWQQAIEDYRKVLEIYPENVDVLNDISTAYLNTGDTKKAIQSLEQALSFSPNHEAANTTSSL